MSEDIFNVDYWEKRYVDSVQKNELHQSIFKCSLPKWKLIENKHREILAKYIDQESILDIGCGWGRLLSLLPESWDGKYTGIDICSSFIKEARDTWGQINSNYTFILGDMRSILTDMLSSNIHYDLAVLISIRPMIKRNVGIKEWGIIEKDIKQVSSKILYLEYDEQDDGSLE